MKRLVLTSDFARNLGYIATNGNVRVGLSFEFWTHSNTREFVTPKTMNECKRSLIQSSVLCLRLLIKRGT